MNDLFCIVTGMEHSGTTYMSSLLMSTPELLGGVECGFLLAAKPHLFVQAQPWFGWMCNKLDHWGWQVSLEDMKSILQAPDHKSMYAILRRKSPIISTEKLVDKTPFYSYVLSDAMRRMPGIPVIVTRKSRAEQAASWNARRMRLFDAYFDRASFCLDEAKREFPERLYIVEYSQWCENPEKIMEGVFSWLGLKWKDEYLSMKAFNEKWYKFGVNEDRWKPFTSLR